MPTRPGSRPCAIDSSRLPTGTVERSAYSIPSPSQTVPRTAMLRVSELKTSYTKTGVGSYVIELTHEGLKKHQLIKGKEPHVVEQKHA